MNENQKRIRSNNSSNKILIIMVTVVLLGVVISSRLKETKEKEAKNQTTVKQVENPALNEKSEKDLPARPDPPKDNF